MRWTTSTLAVSRARTGDIAGGTEVLNEHALTATDSATLTLGERQLSERRAEAMRASFREEMSELIPSVPDPSRPAPLNPGGASLRH